MRNHKLFGLMIGGTMFGMLAMSGIAGAQVPDTYFYPLAPPSVTVTGNDCTSSRQKAGCVSSVSSNSITFKGIFTTFVPLAKGVSCTSSEALDDNFLASGGSTFFISVGDGGIGTLGNCQPAEEVGIGFSFVWKKLTSKVAVPAGAATWVDTDSNTGTVPVTGTMTLLGGSPLSTLGNDCGTWQMNITFTDVPATELTALGLDTNKSTVNVQMDYGSYLGNNYSAACMVLPLSVTS